jgi:hypothetical protein
MASDRALRGVLNGSIWHHLSANWLAKRGLNDETITDVTWFMSVRRR